MNTLMRALIYRIDGTFITPPDVVESLKDPPTIPDASESMKNPPFVALDGLIASNHRGYKTEARKFLRELLK